MSVRTRRALCVAIVACFAGAATAHAQAPPEHSHDMQDMHDMHDMQMDAGWTFMQEGNVYALFNRQGSPRGGDDLEATNWWMGMFSRQSSRHRLTLSGMFSIDAATAGNDGYREIFQVGETLDGQPLVDRQHPHDLFMQLAAAWRANISDTTTMTFAGAPVGEPALGPPTYMHRASAAVIPFAPLSHHLFDSTHISFGVVTAALDRPRWSIEASVFNGREPDDDRWDFDFGRLDSVSARAWYRPSPAWAIQVSSGRLKDPETLEPGDITRTTTSASWLENAEGRMRAATIGYGVNSGHGGNRQGGFAEYSREFSRATVSSRLELVQVESDVLLAEEPDDAAHQPRFDLVTAFTLAAERHLGTWRGIDTGVGASLTFHAVPEHLQDAYGRGPTAFQFFVQVRTLTPGMGRMWNRRMGQ